MNAYAYRSPTVPGRAHVLGPGGQPARLDAERLGGERRDVALERRALGHDRAHHDPLEIGRAEAGHRVEARLAQSRRVGRLPPPKRVPAPPGSPPLRVRLAARRTASCRRRAGHSSLSGNCLREPLLPRRSPRASHAEAYGGARHSRGRRASDGRRSSRWPARAGDRPARPPRAGGSAASGGAASSRPDGSAMRSVGVLHRQGLRHEVRAADARPGDVPVARGDPSSRRQYGSA